MAMMRATPEVIAMVQRMREQEDDIPAITDRTDLLPSGQRACYIPYTSRSEGTIWISKHVFISKEGVRKVFPDIVFVWRGGPAHGWQCYFEREGKIWTGGYGERVPPKPEAPAWAHEAWQFYFKQ